MRFLGKWKPIACAIAIALVSSVAGAHDFWIEADPFVADVLGDIEVRLYVGTGLSGQSLPNISDWYRDFSYVHRGQRHRVPGSLGDDPAGRIEASNTGLYLIGYENLPEFVELEAGKFTSYLNEEGLEKIIRLRASSGTADQDAREYYQRCVKSLVRIGTGAVPVDVLRHSMGYRLEITPLTSPYGTDQVDVRVAFDGEPAADMLVIAFTKQQPDYKQRVRTDSEGRARIALRQAGVWIIKTVEMRRHPGEDADWISYWASLTFEV